jgi:hypothetical protein
MRKDTELWPKIWETEYTVCYSDPPMGIALSVSKKQIGPVWMVGMALRRADTGKLGEMTVLDLGVN